MSVYEADYDNFNEEEEATKIYQIVYLRESILKKYILVPLLSICTVFIFTLCILWYPNLKRIFMYEICTKEQATHLAIVGASKFS